MKKLYLLAGMLMPVVCGYSAINLKSFGENQSAKWTFEENKGQFLSNALFIGRNGGVTIECFNDHLHFTFENKGQKVNQKAEAYFELPNGNRKSEIITENQSGATKNYFLPQTKNGISGVRSFQKITYRNIYQGIDLVLSSKEKGLSYEFIVHPNANPDQIKVKWTGVTSAKVDKNGGMIYKTSAGYFYENKPISYLSDGSWIKTSFSEKKNNVSFKMNKYDRSKTLIIDPDIKWATFWGGEKSDFGTGIVTDKQGNVYVCGYTESVSFFGTKGAPVEKNDGWSDVFLSKFTSNGKLIWSTYFGGLGKDEADGMVIDKSGNLFIVGRTGTDSMATSGVYQTKYGGSSDGYLVGDVFLAKFDSTGNRKWLTYYGGSKIDFPHAISLDKFNEILICGKTKSQSGIATTGAVSNSYKGDNTSGAKYGDGFVAKFDTTGNLKWGTYYGGQSADEVTAICSDVEGNVYFTGFTGSITYISTEYCWQRNRWASNIVNYNHFNYDCFFVKLDKDGKRKWGTYFGSGFDEFVNGISTDDKCNIYLTGYTTSPDSFATADAWDTSSNTIDYNNPATKGFIAKFDSSGNENSRKWCTYYGGSNGTTYGDIIIADPNGTFYVAGVTTNNAGDMATRGAFQKNNNGGTDIFIAKFTTSGKRIWGTYFGGNNADGGGVQYMKNESPGGFCLVDSAGVFYITGTTSSVDLLSTPGAWQENHDSHISSPDEQDAFIAKFDTLSMCSNLKTPSITGSLKVCAERGNVFETYSDPELDYIWIPQGGNVTSGQDNYSAVVKWQSPGKYRLKVIVFNKYRCMDSSEIEVTVLTPVNPEFDSYDGCPGDSIHFKSKENSAISETWNFGDGKNSTDKDPVHVYSKSGTYTVIHSVSNAAGCKDSVFQWVNVFQKPITQFIVKQLNSHLYSFTPQLIDTFIQYSWNFGDSTVDSTMQPTHRYKKSGSYKITLKQTNNYGCSETYDTTISYVNGFAENYNIEEISLYPNPTTDGFMLYFYNPIRQNIEISLFDLTGKRIGILFDGNLNTGQNKMHFKSDLMSAKGVYFLEISSPTGRINEKIIRQ